MKELIEIQSKLEVDKKRYNKFADFHYRSAEDIFNSIKPLLNEYRCFITMNDELHEIGGSVYIKSTARITNSSGEHIEASAYAKEPKTPKAKMDESQTTGSASTYARKYALNALLCLDDSKDPDDGKGKRQSEKNSAFDEDFTENIYKVIISCDSVKDLENLWDVTYKHLQTNTKFKNALTNKKNELKSK